MTNRSIDTNAPAVYLCQVGPFISCGACCGLYNVIDPSLERLEAMLRRRTRWFADVPRTVAGVDDFKARVEAAEPQTRPFPEFHHCPYLGMIEDSGCRVGCLLHPLAKGNNGVDWRGLSFYGGMACRTYFCPSVRHLPAHWLTAVRQSMDHWYLHGLIVTERRLLEAFFMELERRIGRPIDTADFSAGGQAAELFNRFAALKTGWPFRRADAPGAGNYFFEDGLYPRPDVWRADSAIPASPFEVILSELDSGFASKADLKAAEERIEAIIDSLAKQLIQQ
ncbi:hypothetical protein [Desulfosarcina ovata]|uniref:Uncharacterized protein n=1 Tax=Desulfosarcina ovata subsp. ovata TaxID=2752305 RepID=A0A5K8AKP7_9BACT|nr:hypothetical protein [Desulfosarcina ovata]BBO93292.1 hypothetical protein DSCOOX_64720 [Desulfosarcina ovata subsp. ovata]